MGKKKSKPSPPKEKITLTIDKIKEPPHKFDRWDFLILTLIIAVSLFIRIYGLSFPEKVYFDETHYVPAARDFLEPNKIDRNYIHPPLAKHIMAGFMTVFGDNSIGWRSGSVFFGILMIIIMYLLGLAMFRNRFGAVMSASLLGIEFLHITQSRIATLDIYISAFILAGYYFIYLYFEEESKKEKDKEPKKAALFLILSAISMGLAMGVKISALSGIIGVFIYSVYMKIKLAGRLNSSAMLQVLKSSTVYCVIVCFVFFLCHVPLFIKDTSEFGENDINDWGGTIKMLQEKREPEYLRVLSLLSPANQDFVKSWSPQKGIPQQYKDSILNDFENILNDRNFYTPELFQGIPFPDDAKKFAQQGTYRISQKQLRKLNRRLLEQLFPGKIAVSPQIVSLNRMMYTRTFKFHYTDKFEHPYLSHMWEWPLVRRPIWYEFNKDHTSGKITGIVAIGSLLFWWSFLPVLLDMIYRAFKEKDSRLVFILCGYLPLYLFWLSSFSLHQGFHLKGGFFYYMLPCVPFMALALAETLNDLRDSKIGKISIIIYSAGLIAFLILFFPVLTGVPITQRHYDLIMKLDVFKRWI